MFFNYFQKQSQKGAHFTVAALDLHLEKDLTEVFDFNKIRI